MLFSTYASCLFHVITLCPRYKFIRNNSINIEGGKYSHVKGRGAIFLFPLVYKEIFYSLTLSLQGSTQHHFPGSHCPTLSLCFQACDWLQGASLGAFENAESQLSLPMSVAITETALAWPVAVVATKGWRAAGKLCKGSGSCTIRRLAWRSSLPTTTASDHIRW